MPTENRSSNTETVSVPRELAEGIVRMLQGSGGWKTAEQLSAILTKPADQHQGEPVALAIPEECPHLIVFDDTEVASLMFSGAGARVAALKKWEAISVSWNAHLFVRVARNSRDDGHPCAMIADPGTVDRLREKADHLTEANRLLMDDCDTLRAQLSQCEAMAAMVAEREWAEHAGTGNVSSKVEAAFTQLHNDLHEAGEKLAERDALLRESYAELLAIKAEIGFRGATIALIGRIDATLSVSADPESKS
ncbi:hypothetical protein D3C76_560020 [compost metagenome]